jgi:CheY-like chemotaxis protein
VQDTAVTRSWVRQSLGAHGYEAEEATSGEEALARVAAQPRPFDLILLDTLLPGIDGLTVLRELKARPRSKYTPVMVFTPCGCSTVVRQALDLGAAEYLIKPFAPRQLVRRVEKLIGPGQGRTGPEESLLGILRLEINRASRSGGEVSLLVGRRSGPGARALSDLEGYLGRRLRDIDSVISLECGRLAVVLPVTGAQGAQTVMAKLKDWLAILDPEITWQFGSAVYPEHGVDPVSLLNRAQCVLDRQGDLGS